MSNETVTLGKGNANVVTTCGVFQSVHQSTFYLSISPEHSHADMMLHSSSVQVIPPG